MRILHLTTELPYAPGGSGGSTRQFRLLEGLAASGHRVTVVCPVFGFQRESIDLDVLYSSAGLELHSVRRPRAPFAQLATALRREPALAFRVADLPYYGVQARVLWQLMADEVASTLSQLVPDVVTVEHDINASWGARLRSLTPAPLVLTLHNVSSDYYRSRAAATSRIRATRYAIEESRMTRYLRAHLPDFAQLAVVAERDALLAKRLYRGPIAVVPNGTDELVEVLPETGAPVVLFTGTMSHPPNREAIRWFAAEVWPIIRNRRQDARLAVVGRSPQPDVLALARPESGIAVVGEVPAMLPHYARASVVVAPILSGGGTRMKILDAFAAGRAVVSTTVGAEGLSVVEGVDLLIRDDAETFAAAVIELLDDASRRRELAAAGRRLVEERYSWPKIAHRWIQVLERLVGQTSD